MQNTTITITGFLVFLLLTAWKTPALRDGLFARLKRFPQWAQPIPPMLLAFLTAIGQGYLDGVRGDALLTLGASSAGQAGVYAIGIWHIAKRWGPLLLQAWRSIRKTPTATILLVAVALSSHSGCRPVQSPTAVEAATAAVNLTDAALADYLTVLQPSGESIKSWDARVALFDDAAAIVRNKGDYCEAISKVSAVLKFVPCPNCVSAVSSARKELNCK